MPRFRLAAQQARYQAELDGTIHAYHEDIAFSELDSLVLGTN